MLHWLQPCRSRSEAIAQFHKYNMKLWKTVFTIILLLLAARVCSTFHPAQGSMHQDQQTSLEGTLISALHANKTNQEQISRYFCSCQWLVNVSFLVSTAQWHLANPSPAGQLIRVKRTYKQENETSFYNFLVTTSPLLMAVDPQFYCQLQPRLPFIIQNVTCQFIQLSCCKSKRMGSELCFNPQRIELSLYIQHLPATVSEQDMQTTLERILQKVARCTTESDQMEEQWQYNILSEQQTHQRKFQWFFLIVFETCIFVLSIPLLCIFLKISHVLMEEGTLLRSTNCVIGAWNTVIIAGELCELMLNTEITIAFKLLTCGILFLITCLVSSFFQTDSIVKRIASILSVWNLLVFAQYMIFSLVAFLPQMIVLSSVVNAVVLIFLPVIVSILTHYVLYVHYLSSYVPHHKCLLVISEIFLSVFPLHLLLILVSLLDITGHL